MLVAHNPGISDLARLLARDPDAPVFRPADWRAVAV
jgi:phosphohistidine phosphatase SixA